MSQISSDDVRKVAQLARLDLPEDKIATYTSQLESILEYVGQLQQVDTEGVPETTRAVEVTNVTRADGVQPTPVRDDILNQAPQREGDFFRVPKILQDFRNPEEVTLSLGCLVENVVPNGGRLHAIGSGDVGHLHGSGGFRNAFGVHLLKLTHVLEDGLELTGVGRNLVLGQIKAGELGHLADVVAGNLAHDSPRNVRRSSLNAVAAVSSKASPCWAVAKEGWDPMRPSG